MLLKFVFGYNTTFGNVFTSAWWQNNSLGPGKTSYIYLQTEKSKNLTRPQKGSRGCLRKMLDRLHFICDAGTAGNSSVLCNKLFGEIYLFTTNIESLLTISSFLGCICRHSSLQRADTPHVWLYTVWKLVLFQVARTHWITARVIGEKVPNWKIDSEICANYANCLMVNLYMIHVRM